MEQEPVLGEVLVVDKGEHGEPVEGGRGEGDLTRPGSAVRLAVDADADAFEELTRAQLVVRGEAV
ncbi:hypothetical protein ACWCQL_30965 [Streptomyces sp. NPDC002073]